MIYANDFKGKNDSEIINTAIKNRTEDGIVIITAKDKDRNTWYLDEAILLPENTTVVIRNCKLKLSDRCRDNFFRTANSGIGIEKPIAISNVHIRGEGYAVIEGADHPRSTGDRTKAIHAPCPHFPEDICRLADWIPSERRTVDTLDFWDIHNHSYGTDALVPTESQTGDWRNIGILFANTNHFSISGLKMEYCHCWGISLEACSYGYIDNIEFLATMHKKIDGIEMNIENQDGIDIRNGCHHINITNISGCTGDDVIALTAIARATPYVPGGSLNTTHVMHNDWSQREADIHDIIIRNVTAHSYLCFTVRLLPALTKIYNVIIDGIIDTSTDSSAAFGTVLLGDEGVYGANLPNSLSNITVSNVICNSRKAVLISGFLTDSVITNVINKNRDTEAITVERENGIRNVVITNTVTKAL